jgi:hypothetical protein
MELKKKHMQKMHVLTWELSFWLCSVLAADERPLKQNEINLADQ